MSLFNKTLLWEIRQVQAISQVRHRRRRRRCESIRQMARTDAVAVPQFEAAERRGTVLQTDLVEKHFRRSDDPRKISWRYITDLAYPAAFTGVVRVSDPVFSTRVAAFAVRITCTKLQQLTTWHSLRNWTISLSEPKPASIYRFI